MRLTRVALSSAALLLGLCTATALAHPGSGIFAVEDGVIFADTGRGVRKVNNAGELSLITETAMHWLALDAGGAFSQSPDEFGQWFGRITPRAQRPTLISGSDFPIAIGPDGNLYFPFMHGLTIKRRTPAGAETVVATPGDFGYDDEHSVGVNGIACGPDGTIYIVMLDDLHQSEASADHWLYAITPGDEGATVRLIKKNFLPKSARPSADQRHHESIPEYCRGLAVDEHGNVYVAATGSRCVLKVSVDGASEVVMSCQKPWSPTGVAVKAGTVYVLEYDDETPTEGRNWPPRVRALSPDGEVKTLVTMRR